MTKQEILEVISRGEDTQNQFKADIISEVSLAQEIVAMSNTRGGKIFIGVTDKGTIAGLTRNDMERLSNLVSNAASQHVKPAINPITTNVSLEEGLIMIVEIPLGISKPYMDKDGVIWVKSGADKRKATAREELQRLYQNAGLLHADETLLPDTTIQQDIDEKEFARFFEKEFGESISEQGLPLNQLFENLNLAKSGILNLSAVLLFGKNNRFKLPAFSIKCVTYPSEDIHSSKYIDSKDCYGNVRELFDEAFAFIQRNLRNIQNGQNVNSIGELEIPKVVLEELLTNAIIHRDYFITAPIRIFIFSNRVEIISPGHLPNNLTVENIKNGNSNMRNPVLSSFATKILPYRGLGNGIRRAIKIYPEIDFIDDRAGNEFRCTIYRQLIEL